MGKTESFEFLNELALAFRRGETHPRPGNVPVLEGIRKVLAYLQSTNRLVPAGGMALTAEQVENVRAAREELRGYRNFDGNARGRVNRLIAAVDALFPATEPAEEVKPVHPRPNVGDWGYGGGAAVYAPEVRCKTREELLSEKVEQLQAQVRHLSRVAANAAEHGIPAPAVPAEEETKAELCAVRLCSHPMCRHTNWGGRNRKHLRFSDCPIVPVPDSSPVVPAPTETGPWETVDEIPGSVTRIKDCEGDVWHRCTAGWEHGGLHGPEGYAPFVAAEEG